MNNPSIVAPDNGGAPTVPPVPQHHSRRPRVREVSSRFMSPSPSNSYSSSSSAAGDLHSFTTKTPKPSPNNRYSPAPPAADNKSSKPSSSRRLLLPHRASQENHQPSFSSNHDNIPETIRSMDYSYSTTHKKPQQVVKLFKENDNPKSSSSTTSKTSKSSRSDTPIASAAATCDRIVPSRFRLPQNRQTAATSDAAKLLQSTVSLTNQPNESGSISCPNSPMQTQTWPLPDTRSSLSDDEEDRLPTRSRNILRTSSGSCQTSSKFSTPSSLCSRSLNLPISLKTSKPPLTVVATSTALLPPQPTSNKTGLDSKKGKKQQQSSQEDVHSFKLLHNHYLQWRYANAKAESSMHSQTTQMENQLFSLGTDISNLRDTVKRKRAQLNELLRIKAVSTIVEAQMPYLDQWSDVEEDYTCSLSGAANALSNSLLRIPVSGNVQVNVKETAEALESAAKTTDMIVHHMLSLLPKAEEMDTLMSELANVVDTEKALVEECGNLLLTTHNLQVQDCSLRGNLMQLAM